MATPKNTLKTWFSYLKKPTEAQFWAWIDAFWHRDEPIPPTAIDGLDGILNKKADLIDNLIPQEQIPHLPDSKVDISEASEFAQVGNTQKTFNKNVSNDLSELKTDFQTEVIRNNSQDQLIASLQSAISLLNSWKSSLTSADSDNIVNTLTELLASVQNVPEGTDIFQLINSKINIADIVNDLNSLDTTKVLSANQGKVLKDLINALQSQLNALFIPSTLNDLSDVDTGQSKTIPVDTDDVLLRDSVGNAWKKLSWVNIKGTLKSYFDGFYKPLSWFPTWSEITGKPSTFAPSAHTHPISEVDNLSSTLAVKVPQDRKIAGVDLLDDITAQELTSALNTASQSLKGLMSAADKAKLDALSAILGADADADTVVNTINEVLAIFQNYPEGANLVNALAGKENTVPAGTTAQYYRGDKNWAALDKSAVGLGNVPNTDATNPANISWNTNYRTVTDSEKTGWNGKVGGSGTANYLPKWSASGTQTNSQFFDDGTSAAIGNSSGASDTKLTVRAASSQTYAFKILDPTGMYFPFTIGKLGHLSVGTTGGTTIGLTVAGNLGSDYAFATLNNINSAYMFRVGNNGNVGIGTYGTNASLSISSALGSSYAMVIMDNTNMSYNMVFTKDGKLGIKNAFPTYDIDVTGQIRATGGFVGNVDTATSATRSGYLNTTYVGGQQLNPQIYFNNDVGLRVAMTAAAGTWSDTLWINGYNGGDVLSMCALHFKRDGTPRMYISSQNSTATSYGTLYEVLTAYNYSNYNSFSSIYATNWFRSTGASGWYNEDYAGGIYMSDVSWVRVYGGKGFHADNAIRGTDIQDAYYQSLQLGTKTLATATTIDNTYHNCVVYITAGVTVTVPTGLRADFHCVFEVIGTYTANISFSSGVTFEAPFGQYLKNNNAAILKFRGTNLGRLTGNTATS